MKKLILSFIILTSFNSFADDKSCGLSGTIDERISDCNFRAGYRGSCYETYNSGYRPTPGNHYDLVLRDSIANMEVWRSVASGEFFSKTLGLQVSHYTASRICQTKVSNFLNLPGVTWRLINSDDQALTPALDCNITSVYWLSDTIDDPYTASVWDIVYDYQTIDSRSKSAGVLCIGSAN